MALKLSSLSLIVSIQQYCNVGGLNALIYSDIWVASIPSIDHLLPSLDDMCHLGIYSASYDQWWHPEKPETSLISLCIWAEVPAV
eukprot:scaffold637_cov109-Cylindrotheca_fusiformis.AAC.2